MKHLKVIIVAAIVVIISLVLYLYFQSNNSLTFYKGYNIKTNEVSEQADKFQTNTTAYAKIKLNKPFATNVVGITIYNSSNEVISGSSIKANPNASEIVYPITLGITGDFIVKIYLKKPDNIVASRELTYY